MTKHTTITLVDLVRIQDFLDLHLVDGSVSLAEYTASWTLLLSLAHMSNEDYAAAIDARWVDERMMAEN